MVLKKDQERIKVLLKDTITLLCKNGLTFRNEFSIEATIGITLDQDEVLLVSINEIIQSELNAKKLAGAEELTTQSKAEGDNELSEENNGYPPLSSPSRSQGKRQRSKAASMSAECSNGFESGGEGDDTSHTSELEPPMKKHQREIKCEDDGDSDDLVFVKQEIESGDWMDMGGQGQSSMMQGNEQDSFQASFSTSSQSQSDQIDFLQGSLEPVPTHSLGSPNLNRVPRRTATVTSNSTPDRSNSQVSDPSGPLQLVTHNPEKSVAVSLQQEANPTVKALKLANLVPGTATVTRVFGGATGSGSVPCIQPDTFTHNLVMLSPHLIASELRQRLTLMSAPLCLPLAPNIPLITGAPASSQLPTATLSLSLSPAILPRHAANLTVTSPSIRGPRLASDLPLSFSPVDTLLKPRGKVGKSRRSSACSSTSSMDPPMSPLEKSTKSRSSSRRSSAELVALKLNESQEKEIVTFINNMASLGYKVSVKEVCKMAHEMIFPKRQYKKMDVSNIKTFGPEWWTEFLARHPEIFEKEGQVFPCSAPNSV